MTIDRAPARRRSMLAGRIGPRTKSLAARSVKSAGSLLRWLARRPRSTVLVTTFLGAASIGVVLLIARAPWSPGSAIGDYRVDLDVYRIGSRLWLAGHNLYEPIRTAHGGTLPFLYPPLSAILFTPLAVQPFALASIEITVLSVLCLAAVLLVSLRTFYPRGLGRKHWLALGILLPVALVFEPVRSTLSYGQINLLLMGLVALDCLAARSRWPRGALIGLAAAVKLTPAAFVLFFLLRKDWRSALRAGISFVVCAGIGFVLDWHDSVSYWTKVAYQTNRIGLGYIGNQSITAVLMRFGLQPPLRSAVYLALVAVFAVLAVLAMRRALAAGQWVLALSLNGVLELLASPISWSHHWVWSVPLVLSLVMLGRRRRAVLPLLVAFAGLLLFTIAPQWWMPNPRHWHFWQQIQGNCYVYFGVLLLIGAAFLPLRLRRSRSTDETTRPARRSELSGALS
ncbi:MAG TPA: glycosyltransferase 87 family protein [Pseudonocardiaceae bacterium]|nr:glycosyltransferase 87 family protein [Pseudonocardiaceae bacterium]